MAKKSAKPANPIDAPRPNQVGVSLTDEALTQLDEFRSGYRLTRSHAAALLIERGLQAERAKAAS